MNEHVFGKAGFGFYVLLLVSVLFIRASVVNAQQHSWNRKNKQSVKVLFEVVWEKAVANKVIAAQRKPHLRFKGKSTEACFNLDAFVPKKNVVALCTSFLAHNENHQSFIIAHEIMHLKLHPRPSE